jgi:hypothetical protein
MVAAGRASSLAVARRRCLSLEVEKMPDEFGLNETDDSREIPSPPWPTRHPWKVLGGWIVIQTALALLFFHENYSRAGESFFIAMLGSLFSHPLLFALWAALAPQRFYVRFLWCLPLSFGVSFLVELKYHFTNRGHVMDFFIILISMSIFVLATAILLLVRRFTRWQLRQRSNSESASDYQPYQFGIKHMLILTTIIGAVSGLFKSLIVISDHATMPSLGELTRILSEILLMIVPILFVFWLTLINLSKRKGSAIAAIIFLAFAEIAVYIFVPMIEGSRTRMNEVIPFFQIGCGLSVIMTAMVIRRCGFRMVRGS